ncbi:hypothetical protein HYH03_010898 [Edaphochlamys debaryana]|uniref:Endonuclease/exonuclease/phosphatase domain-containing protein n=1 Tax=Edaphochlamys debaryana TaxID=47281 RepID=A0A835XV38_9CHLO|nr:hypothetical protein HYH03_010898 [Edaphochlamys debaryana]|eukprot:KAG2490743.1 hypothetical protein HYH03_010898 [Edaphochlamys debaryana]
MGRRAVLVTTACVAALSWVVGRVLGRRGVKQSKARRVRRPEPLTSTDPDEISVVVWNILADHYCTPKRYPYVRPDWLSWPHRWALLQEQLGSFGSDLICLQEVEPSRWQQILDSPALHGYSGIIQDRRGDNLIANAILYRTSKLAPVWTESRSRALLAAFAFWDGLGQQQVLWVANLHLEGSPYRPNDRISQTRSALQRLEAAQRERSLAPGDELVLVVGDFNSGRSESVCHFLHRGRLEGGSTEPHLPRVEVTKTSIAHPFPLHEAYSSGGHELPFTRKVQSPSGPGTSDMALRWPQSVQPLPLLLALLAGPGPALGPRMGLGRAWGRGPYAPTAAAAAAAAVAAAARGGRWWRRLRGWCQWQGPRVPALASTLDFIWASCQMEVSALYWPVECRHEGLISLQALPNQHYPSDHLPIGALLRCKHFYADPEFGDTHPPPPLDPAVTQVPAAVQDFSPGPEADPVELQGMTGPSPLRGRSRASTAANTAPGTPHVDGAL